MANERQFYDSLVSFVQREMGCVSARKEIGQDFGSIDVLGIRHVSNDLASRYELVSVEVKEDGTRFLNAVGQALAYSVSVHRCYLAYHLPKGKTFSQEQKDIADHFGVGLISLSKAKPPKLISTSRLFSPRAEYSAHLLNKLECYICVLCGAIHQRKDIVEVNRPGPIQPEAATPYVGQLDKAIKKRKAALWYLYDVADAKKESRTYVYDRRILCKDCVSIFASLGHNPSLQARRP